MAFGNKNSTPSFVLTLPIKATEQDEIFLSKKFRVGCTVKTRWLRKPQKCGTSCAKRANTKIL